MLVNTLEMADFCPTRCAYCSFVSQSVEKSMALVPEFLQALAREIADIQAVLNGEIAHGDSDCET